MISSVVPTPIWLVKRQPTLERIMFGLYRSDLGFAIKTASTDAASAVRNNAPILPGFSGASATSTKGVLSLKTMFASAWSLERIKPMMPSVVPRCAILP